MTDKELHDKLGALHLRLLDDEDNYIKMYNLLIDYSECCKNFGQSVNKALREGLQNHERYLKLDNALSPRSIIVEKKEGTDKASKSEGNYQIVFVLDDDSRHVIHFGRKQSHLLYILFLLCSRKNGLLTDFFQKDDSREFDVIDVVALLAQLIFPSLRNKAKEARLLALELGPDKSFSDSLQKMKAPLVKCLKAAKMSDDLYWYMPFAVNLKRKQLYNMHMPSTKIVLPAEFQPIIDALPDANDFLKKLGISADSIDNDLEHDFAHWQQLAKEGDVDGLFHVGVFYATGDIVSQDYHKSIDYFQQAAQKGSLDALYQIGILHMWGFGVKKDIHQAVNFFTQAADHGHVDAAATLGQIYERGDYGIKTNYQKAFKYYMIAAEQDNEEGMWYVIQGYLLGNGTPVDEDKAYEWFKKSQALGYYNIGVLYGVHLMNKGDEDSLEAALPLFLEGCENDVPIAYYMMCKMVLKGYGNDEDRNKEAYEWLMAGAFLGDDHCINTIKKTKPDIYELYADEWEEPLSLRDSFIQLIGEMDVHSKESFLQIVDAYSYKWHDRYVAEICKQLNIHKSYCDDGGDHTPRRRITVRKSKGGKLPYELVLTLANGKEVVINKINLNSLVLYLLTLICSYKSGYTTMMAKSESCRPVLKELARLVCGSHVQDFDDYVEAYMSYEKDEANKKNEDYYKKYSNDAKVALKKSLDVFDDTDCFLFNIHRVGKKILRRSNLDSQYIELPPELMELAINMPDAMDVIQGAEKQEDTSVAQE